MPVDSLKICSKFRFNLLCCRGHTKKNDFSNNAFPFFKSLCHVSWQEAWHSGNLKIDYFSDSLRRQDSYPANEKGWGKKRCRKGRERGPNIYSIVMKGHSIIKIITKRLLFSFWYFQDTIYKFLFFIKLQIINIIKYSFGVKVLICLDTHAPICVWKEMTSQRMKKIEIL